MPWPLVLTRTSAGIASSFYFWGAILSICFLKLFNMWTVKDDRALQFYWRQWYQTYNDFPGLRVFIFATRDTSKYLSWYTSAHCKAYKNFIFSIANGNKKLSGARGFPETACPNSSSQMSMFPNISIDLCVHMGAGKHKHSDHVVCRVTWFFFQNIVNLWVLYLIFFCFTLRGPGQYILMHCTIWFIYGMCNFRSVGIFKIFDFDVTIVMWRTEGKVESVTITHWQTWVELSLHVTDILTVDKVRFESTKTRNYLGITLHWMEHGCICVNATMRRTKKLMYFYRSKCDVQANISVAITRTVTDKEIRVLLSQELWRTKVAISTSVTDWLLLSLLLGRKILYKCCYRYTVRTRVDVCVTDN